MYIAMTKSLEQAIGALKQAEKYIKNNFGPDTNTVPLQEAVHNLQHEVSILQGTAKWQDEANSISVQFDPTKGATEAQLRAVLGCRVCGQTTDTMYADPKGDVYCERHNSMKPPMILMDAPIDAIRKT